MQTNKNFIFFFVILFILSSCCKEAEYHNIPDKQRFKIKQNDTFIYKSNFGNFDTLFIWNEDNFYFGFGKSSEGLICRYDILNENLIFYFNKFNENEEGNYAIIKQICSENNTLSYFFQLNEIKLERQTKLETVLINNIEYENIIQAETECINDSSICIIYINNELGILSYEFCNGEKYELIKYLSSKK